MKIIKKIITILETIEKWLLVFFLSVIILFSFLQVILREVFETGIIWGDIVLRHLVLWIGFLGACIAVDHNKHFAIDVIRKFIPDNLKIAVDIIINIFVLVVLYFLCGAALAFFKDDFSFGSTLFTIKNVQVASYWFNSIIPLGFILLFLHYLLTSGEKIMVLFSPSQKQNQERTEL
jgi:C4-dicarboxylate transporter, DctQ subunit